MELGKWLKGRFGQPPVPTPLYDFVERCKPEGAVLHLESSQDGDEHRLSTTVVMLTLALSRDFLHNHTSNIERFYGPFNRDVLAFEAVVFFQYALKAYYEKSEYDDYTDDRYEEYFETFQNATFLIRKILRKYSSASLDEVFVHRYNSYLKSPSVDGKNGAAEHFRIMLQSIAGAIVPVETYGRVSLDLQKTLEMIAIVQAFSASFLTAYCKTLTNLIGEYRPVPD